MSAPAFYAHAAPEVSIRDGNGVRDWPNGLSVATRLNALRLEHALIGKALAEHDARCAEVIPLRPERAARRRRGQ